MANVIKGNDVVFYLQIEGVNRAVCQAKDTKLSTSADLIETTTKDGKRSKTFNYQGKNTSFLTVSGLTNLVDEANFSTFTAALLAAQKIPFLFTDNDSFQYTGVALIPQIDFDSPDNAISSFNTTLQIDGELVPVYSTDVPIPIGNSVQIIDQFGNVLATVVAPGVYQVLVYDTIDEAGWATPDLITIEGQ